MQFTQKTILELFDSSQKSFIIPVYQRAYSWSDEEWKIFLQDILEQIRGNNNYFYGNLLLETIKKGVEYEVIDGQQRLTTLSIFMRSLISIIKERQEKEEEIDIDVEEKEKIYLKDRGVIKIRPVEYDRACFDALIVEGKEKFEVNTPSQKRIREARDYFIKELRKLTTADVLKIFEKIESTELTCIELKGKKDSALMFELQNNRGRELTNMEKIKSYFMYQMYVYSKPEETEDNIQNISNLFKLIYLIINDLKRINEDSVLIYHCQAYIKGYPYRTLDDIKEVFLKAPNKVEWIKAFVGELHTSFSNMKKLENSANPMLANLNQLSIPAFAYPFFIKGYKYFGDNEDKLTTLFHILEVAVFRYRLVNSRADIISRLNEILGAFKGDLQKLRKHFKDKFNEAFYWGDYKVKEIMSGWLYENRALNYILWQYEAHIQPKGYKVGKIVNEAIEHISPRTPTINYGYEVNENGAYENDFFVRYLHSIGNLVLISTSHNSSIGNKPFPDKLQSFNDNPLLRQQAEIKKYVIEENQWNRNAIAKRQSAIVNDFALLKWSFESIEIQE